LLFWSRFFELRARRMRTRILLMGIRVLLSERKLRFLRLSWSVHVCRRAFASFLSVPYTGTERLEVVSVARAAGAAVALASGRL
jgi:hypothetical protein